jgi:hypothetical protein
MPRGRSFFLLYFSSAGLWLSRRKPWISFGLTVILFAPTLLLSIWLGLVEHNPIGPLVWLAPFLGIGAGVNLRVALGKAK